MTKHAYEINVHGHLSAGLLAELGAGGVVVAPTETVVITGNLAPDQLHTILSRIADLGLDMRELRRLPFPVTPR